MEEVDAALARKAAVGDAAAFTTLVRRHERKVRAFLERLTRGQGADDLAQEVVVKAWRQAASWRAEGSYGAWLMSIAWTSFLSANRGTARRLARDHEASRPEAPISSNPGTAIDIDRALAGLGVRERGAALLCFGEGYSHGEAAEILGIPLGTLKSAVARARAQLVQALEG